MVHKHSPAALLRRRERAHRLGFLPSTSSLSLSCMLVPTAVKERATQMVESLSLHYAHNQRAGHASHYARQAALCARLPPTELKRTLATHRRANRAKHHWPQPMVEAVPAPKASEGNHGATSSMGRLALVQALRSATSALQQALDKNDQLRQEMQLALGRMQKNVDKMRCEHRHMAAQVEQQFQTQFRQLGEALARASSESLSLALSSLRPMPAIAQGAKKDEPTGDIKDPPVLPLDRAGEASASSAASADGHASPKFDTHVGVDMAATTRDEQDTYQVGKRTGENMDTSTTDGGSDVVFDSFSSERDVTPEPARDRPHDPPVLSQDRSAGTSSASAASTVDVAASASPIAQAAEADQTSMRTALNPKALPYVPAGVVRDPGPEHPDHAPGIWEAPSFEEQEVGEDAFDSDDDDEEHACAEENTELVDKLAGTTCQRCLSEITSSRCYSCDWPDGNDEELARDLLLDDEDDADPDASKLLEHLGQRLRESMCSDRSLMARLLAKSMWLRGERLD